MDSAVPILSVDLFLLEHIYLHDILQLVTRTQSPPGRSVASSNLSRMFDICLCKPSGTYMEGKAHAYNMIANTTWVVTTALSRTVWPWRLTRSTVTRWSPMGTPTPPAPRLTRWDSSPSSARRDPASWPTSSPSAPSSSFSPRCLSRWCSWWRWCRSTRGPSSSDSAGCWLEEPAAQESSSSSPAWTSTRRLT